MNRYRIWYNGRAYGYEYGATAAEALAKTRARNPHHLADKFDAVLVRPPVKRVSIDAIFANPKGWLNP